MLNFSRASLRIGISRSGIAVLRSGGWRPGAVEVLCDLPFAADDTPILSKIKAGLDSVMTEIRSVRLPASVIVSDELVRFFMVTPPHNASSLHDCHAAATLRFRTLFGDAANEWKIEAQWSFQRSFLACALPLALFEAIERMAKEHHLTLMEIVPRFVRAWNTCASSLKPRGWFGVMNEDTLSLGVITRGHLDSVRTIALPGHDPSNKQWLSQCISREALLLNVEMPSYLKLSGSVPGHWESWSDGRCIYECINGRLPGIGSDSSNVRIQLAKTGMR